MNNKGGTNRKSETRTNKPGSNKPKPAMQKRAQGRKKINKSFITTDTTNKTAQKSEQFSQKPKEKEEIRLNKYIANSGACSRRDADIYIRSGNVKVNGVPITEMGYMVKPGDIVNFDGAIVSPEKKVYILLNKPKNFTTALDEGQEYRNVLELLKGSTTAKIGPIGRMDKNTTGLLLFTNDTEMIRKFSLPNQRSSKIYQVSLDKNLKFEDLEKINKGLVLEGHRVAVEEVSYIEGEAKSEIGIKLKSSNIKVVRSIFEHFNYNVLKIDRVAFAGLTKKNLPRGNWRILTDQEIINLKNG